MKQSVKALFGALLLILFGASVISCNKDNEEQLSKQGITYTVVSADELVGTHYGILTMYLQEMPNFELPTMDTASYSIIAQDNGKATITIPTVQYNLNGSIKSLTGFVLTDVEVKKGSDGKYYFAEKDINQTVDEMAYVGKFKGMWNNNVLTLDYSIKAGRMPMTLIFHFETAFTLANAADIAGSFVGTIDMNIEGMDMAMPSMENASVVVTAQNDGKATVTIPTIVYVVDDNQREMAGFDLADVVVLRDNDGKYYLKEIAINQIVNEMTYVGSLLGEWAQNRLALDFSIQPGRMPMKINFVFNTNQ